MGFLERLVNDMAQSGSDAVRADQEFVELRLLLFSIAYRMLGSVAEAEDVVQDAFLRWRRAVEDGAEVTRRRATWRPR